MQLCILPAALQMVCQLMHQYLPYRAVCIGIYNNHTVLIHAARRAEVAQLHACAKPFRNRPCGVVFRLVSFNLAQLAAHIRSALLQRLDSVLPRRPCQQIFGYAQLLVNFDKRLRQRLGESVQKLLHAALRHVRIRLHGVAIYGCLGYTVSNRSVVAARRRQLEPATEQFVDALIISPYPVAIPAVLCYTVSNKGVVSHRFRQLEPD